MNMNSQLSIFLRHLLLDPDKVYYMMTPAELIEESVKLNMGQLADTGALCIDTGKFTGRSPKDRFLVKDDIKNDTPGTLFGELVHKLSMQRSIPGKVVRLLQFCVRSFIKINNHSFGRGDYPFCSDEPVIAPASKWVSENG